MEFPLILGRWRFGRSPCSAILTRLQLLRRSRMILLISIRRMLLGLTLSWSLLSLDGIANADGLCRVGDSIWEVSSRALPDCPQTGDIPQLELFHFQNGCWPAQPPDSLKQFLSATSGQRIVMYVHGNRMSQQDLHLRAQQVYRRLVSSVRCEPICFIAYSWPSNRRGRLGDEIELKKMRLNADAYYLASFVQSLELQQPVGYLGYSFGSAVVCGAHHLLAGGVLNGNQLTELPAKLYEDRVSLIAPAFDRQGLTPHGRFSQALVGVEKVVNLYNSNDPILKRFRFFDLGSAPIAAGFAGIADPSSTSPLDADARISQYDCRCIGRTHLELDYHTCPSVVIAFRNAVGQ